MDFIEYLESNKRNFYVQVEKLLEDDSLYRKESYKNLLDINKNDLKFDVKVVESLIMRFIF